MVMIMCIAEYFGLRFGFMLFEALIGNETRKSNKSSHLPLKSAIKLHQGPFVNKRNTSLKDKTIAIPVLFHENIQFIKKLLLLRHILRGINFFRVNPPLA